MDRPQRVQSTPSDGPTYTGRVVTGLGDCARHMAALRAHYRSATGLELYPGTPNLELAEPFDLPAQVIRLEGSEYGGDVNVSIVPCFALGRRAMILRTDANDRGTGDHPRNIVELAAEVQLRDAHGLADGDLVTFTIEPAL